MRFGIMQGRLSPPQGEALQFFPDDWQGEFETAKALGFEAIEWIFDDPIDENPILSEAGRALISARVAETGVGVASVCADHFIKNHLIRSNDSSVEVLEELLVAAGKAGVSIIGIPFVENHIPKSASERDWVAENILDVLDWVPSGAKIALEMDLPADEILSILRLIDKPNVGICYDTGNVMTLGFDAGEDIRKLGEHIFEIHLKDRIRFTRQSVNLGTGSVDFPDVFRALSEVRFNGLCILQAWRGADFIADAKAQLEFAKRISNQFLTAR